MTKRMIRLASYVKSNGHHVAGWRQPGAPSATLDVQLYRDIARTLERGRFDALFLADSLAIRAQDLDSFKYTARNAEFEPFTLLAALSSVTDRLGLIGTVTTTYNEPFHVARKFASLDHLSGGRAGWNLVTSNNTLEAHNFGRDEHVEHAERYARAEEFFDVTTKLWDSWEDEAFLRDKQAGVYFDPERVHVPKHEGQYFRVRGPLNVERPIQGRPVIVQAGTSEAGRDLAARVADVVFVTGPSVSVAKAFYDDLKARAARFGRAPEAIKILFGVAPIVAATDAAAQAKLDGYQRWLHPVAARQELSGMLGGVDLSGLADNALLPVLDETALAAIRDVRLRDAVRAGGLTVEQAYRRYTGLRGHRVIVGSAATVADELEAHFSAGAADGFIIMPAVLPESLNDFVDLVVPELQRRGLFRQEYEGLTLRENLGLERPVNQWAVETEVA